MFVSAWLSPRSYFYFWARDSLLSTLGFLAAMEWSVVKRSRTVCHKGMGRFLPSIYLPLPLLPRFSVPPCLPGWSLVFWCYPICNWNRVASFLSSNAASLFSTRAATFDSSAKDGCAGNDRSSLPYFAARIVTSTYAFSSSWSHLSGGCDAQCSSQALAVRCALTSRLLPHGPSVYFPSPSPLYLP